MTHIDASSSTIAPVGSPRSPWHSPVPYLFGGLAAMLGLIAFALLILACSYWRLSGYLEENQEGDLEQGNNNGNSNGDGDVKMVDPPILEEKFLVIMAGQLKPTYIATPSLSSRASSFGSNSNCTVSSESSTDKSEGEENDEEKMTKEENGLSSSSFENEEVYARSVSANDVARSVSANDISNSSPENEEGPTESVLTNSLSNSTPKNEEVPIKSILTNGVSSLTPENEKVPTQSVSTDDVSSSTPENEEVPTRSVSSCNESYETQIRIN